MGGFVVSYAAGYKGCKKVSDQGDITDSMSKDSSGDRRSDRAGPASIILKKVNSLKTLLFVQNYNFNIYICDKYLTELAA